MRRVVLDPLQDPDLRRPVDLDGTVVVLHRIGAIARSAGCSVRTVQRAIADGRISQETCRLPRPGAIGEVGDRLFTTTQVQRAASVLRRSQAIDA